MLHKTIVGAAHSQNLLEHQPTAKMGMHNTVVGAAHSQNLFEPHQWRKKDVAL